MSNLYNRKMRSGKNMLIRKTAMQTQMELVTYEILVRPDHLLRK